MKFWLLCLGCLGIFLYSSQASALSKEKPGTKKVRVEFKPGKGIKFRAPNDYAVLRVRLWAQFRYILDQAASKKDWVHSLQIQRARLAFDGSLMGRHNRFNIQLAFSPKDLKLSKDAVRRIPLLDWYLDFTHLRDLRLRLGQYKVPFARGRMISSANFAMIERSIIDSEFKLDRDMGFDLYSKDFLGLKRLRYFLGVYMGNGHSALGLKDFGLMYLVRFEVLPMGSFKSYDQINFSRESSPHLALGASYVFVDRSHLNKGIEGSAPADGGTTSSHHIEADLLFKWNGLTLHSEFLWREGSREAGDKKDENGQAVPVALPRNGLGFFVLLSYILPKAPLSFAFRYAAIRPSGSAKETSLTAKDAMGGGISYYFASHFFKLQADFFHIWKSLDITKGEERLRLQLQTAF